MSKVIDTARERGSSATTRAGAWRYLLAQVAKLPSRPLDPEDAPPRYNRLRLGRDEWRARDEERRAGGRWAGWRERHADILAALDRALKAQERRERLAEIAEEDAPLRAAGYTLVLSDDRRHRVLAGLDDGHPFTVQVPLRVRGIGEALRWLRPDGVPSDATRQGEWFFVARDPEPETASSTAAGSWREVGHEEIATFDARGRHEPDECLAVIARGETAFVGRREVRTHAWTGRPRVYARGKVRHPEHATLDLGSAWHEVIPNRATPPFAVRGGGVGGLD